MAKPYIVINLAGKDTPMLLKMGYNELSLFQQLTGKEPSQLFGADSQMGPLEIRAMLFCGLRWNKKDLTLDDVGDMLDDHVNNFDGEAEEAMQYIFNKFSEAASAGKKAEGDSSPTGSGKLVNLYDIDEAYRLALNIGLKPQEFWLLAPFELADLVDQYNKKQKERYKDLIYLAWHTAAFQRLKKIPSLEKVLKNKKQSKPQKKHSQEECIKAAREEGLKGPWG